MSATVLSVSSRALLDACARLGHDRAQILAAAGLDESAVSDTDARIPAEKADALWQKAYQVSRDPNLALHAVEALPFGAYRVIDFLAATSPTVGESLAKISDYFPLIRPTMVLPYKVGNRVATFGVEAPASPAPLSRPIAEYTLAACFLRTRFATNQRYSLVRVEFSQPRPADISEHERIFECPVVFGAAACQMVIAREVWDTPRVESNPSLFAVLETHAKMLINQLPNPDDIVARVRHELEPELRGGSPKLESVARRLAMSPRTLQRRLRDRGLVFNDVLDSMRFRAAKSYLSQRDIAGVEVAYLLGFAEQSSFNRAFKRWSGQTPIEYRRQSVAV